MSRRLLWFSGGASQSLFVARLATLLAKEYGCSVDQLTHSPTSAQALRDRDHSCLLLSELLDTTHPEQEHVEEWVTTANSRLKATDINMLIHCDRQLSMVSSRRLAQHFAARVVVALDNLLEEGRYDIYLSIETGGLVGRALTLLTEQRGIPSFAPTVGCGFGHCQVTRTGSHFGWSWPAMYRLWEKTAHQVPTDEARRAVDAYRDAYVSDHEQRPRSRLDQVRPGWRARRLSVKARVWEALYTLSKAVRGPRAQGRDVDSLRDLARCYPDVLGAEFRSLSDAKQKRWTRTHESFRYDVAPERFIYLPINMSWEAGMRTSNPMNHLQKYIIEVVLESLPFGVDLVVKEHPYALGEWSHSELGALQEKGVKITAPDTHSLELIRDAEAVFCLGDTSGWEGVLLKTPVIVYCAEPFYVVCPGVYHLSDPNGVHRVLRTALEKGRDCYADDNAWCNFIHAALVSSYPGNVFGYKGLVWSDLDHSDDNLKKIVNMLTSEPGIVSDERECTSAAGLCRDAEQEGVTT